MDDGMLTRRAGESQLDCVRRLLVERGSLGGFEVIFRLRYPDGSPTSITRLGARVMDLRAEGFVLENRAPAGHLADYHVVRSPYRVDETGRLRRVAA
ncbi:MAG: hypothetical protein C0498_01560 [Anaerolinea sp.]|nr:hypothetical protein [Anaerolinea sp.]